MNGTNGVNNNRSTSAPLPASSATPSTPSLSYFPADLQRVGVQATESLKTKFVQFVRKNVHPLLELDAENLFDSHNTKKTLRLQKVTCEGQRDEGAGIGTNGEQIVKRGRVNEGGQCYALSSYVSC